MVLDVIIGRAEAASRLARHRDELWTLRLRVAVLCAHTRSLCRRSRWEARRSRLIVLRTSAGGTRRRTPRLSGTRRRSRAALRAV